MAMLLEFHSHDGWCAVRTGFYRANLMVLTTFVLGGEREALEIRRLQQMLDLTIQVSRM